MDNQVSKTNLLLTTNETASLLGCAPQTLKISRHTGILFGVNTPSFLKMGRSVRYKRETLDVWLKQFEEQSTTTA